MSFFSLTLTFFLLLDSFGNVPVFLSVLKHVDSKRYPKIILREMLIAFFVLVLCYFGGNFFFEQLQIKTHSVSIAGAIILFLIAIRMIFPHLNGNKEEVTLDSKKEDPFIVPLAIPLIAGPACIVYLMVSARTLGNTTLTLGALFVAWVLSTIVLMSSSFLKQVLGKRGLEACEKLMGLILTIFSVQMFLSGISDYLLTCK